MNPTPFKSETTPWRVQLPASLSADGKRKACYFKTPEEAKAFCAQLKRGKGPYVTPKELAEIARELNPTNPVAALKDALILLKAREILETQATSEPVQTQATSEPVQRRRRGRPRKHPFPLGESALARPPDHVR